MRLTWTHLKLISQPLSGTSRPGHTNPYEEIMGSTPYGNANPMTLIGPALPPNIEIDRAGHGRVRVGGRT
jgi:hypothetical protein